MIDYHIHTRLCKHAEGEINAYIESAVKKGIKEIGFTDHCPLPGNFDIAHRMSYKDMDIYSTWITSAQERFKDEIKILFGIEMDYYRGFEDYTMDFLNKYDFDLVIMSVHFIKHWPEGNWVFGFNFKNKSLEEIYSDYLSTLIEGIELEAFDIIGHADILKIHSNSFIHIIPDKVELFLKHLKKHDMVLEINTSGFRKNVKDSFPGYDWFPLIKQHNIPVCIGSDAHSPDQVGLNFPETYNALEKAGIKDIVRFEKRNKL